MRVVHLEAVADAEEAEPGAPTQARAPRRPHCAAGGHPYPTVPAAPAPRAGPLCRGSPGLPVAPGDRHVRLPSLRRCWASRRLGRARLFWLLCPRLRRVGPGPGYGALCSGGRARCSRGRRRRAQARYADSIESLVRNNIQKIKTDMANEVIDAGRFDMETTMAERRVTLESMLQARPRGGPEPPRPAPARRPCSSASARVWPEASAVWSRMRYRALACAAAPCRAKAICTA